MSNAIRLSDAQVSAMECRDWSEDPAVCGAWDGAHRLEVGTNWQQLADEINEASNAEDAHAQLPNADRACRVLAGRAARSLCALACRVVRSRPA